MRKWAAFLLAVLILTGCGGKQMPAAPEPENQPEPPAVSAPEKPAATVPAAPSVPKVESLPQPSSQKVRLEWSGESLGEWPFEVTVETLRFTGHEDPELEEANETMRADVENQIFYYEAALEKGEEQCRANGDSWGSIWTYPVTTDRYLSAVTVQRQHMQFRIADPYTWNMVKSNFVYDQEEQRLISLDEALDWMGMSVGDLERGVWEFADDRNIGIYEDLSSVGFYMAPEGYPVFIIGAVVYGHGPSVGWPTFFNWDNGEIRWSGEEPMPLYLVDTEWDEMACLQGMGQYDGAAIISEEEAFDTLAQIVEVQELLSQGMVMINAGITENIDGEEHICIAVGADHGDRFVTEFLYAVSWLSVYCMDPVHDDWIPVGFG